jgi:hypothetical protein
MRIGLWFMLAVAAPVAAQTKGKKASLGAGGFRFSSPDCKPSRASSGKGT